MPRLAKRADRVDRCSEAAIVRRLRTEHSPATAAGVPHLTKGRVRRRDRVRHCSSSEKNRLTITG
jgi:hypothetical protein